MLNPMTLIKRSIQALAAVILLLMLFFSVGGTWATAHPDSALARGFDAWEEQGDISTRVDRFFAALTAADQSEQAKQREHAQDQAAAERERKEAANRRFNSGEMSGDTYNSEY